MSDPTPTVSAVRTAGEPRWAWGAVASTVALAGALLAYESARQPLWFTEICILRAVDRPFSDMLRLIAADIHPPLQFVLRWVVSALGGCGSAQRAVSIVCAAAAIVPTFTLGRRLFGARVGVLGAVLSVLPPAVVHFGQEVEDYSLQWLLTAALAHFAFAWCERGRRRDAAGYVTVAVLACYSHYVSVVVVAVSAVLGVAWLRHEPRRIGPWLLLHAGVAALFAPQLPIALQQYAREGNGVYFRWPSTAALLSLARTIGFGTRVGALLLAALVAVALVRRRTRAEAAALVALGTLPVLATRLWVVILPREALFVVPFWMLAAAAGASGLPHRALRAGVTVGLLGLGLAVSLRPRAADEAARTAAALAWIETRARPGEVIVHAETHSLLFFLWHAPRFENRILVPPGSRIPFFEGGLVVPDGAYETPAECAARMDRAGTWGVWVNRASATRGTVRRAGAASALVLRSTLGDSAWHAPPVTVWHRAAREPGGGTAAQPARSPRARGGR